MTLHSESRPGQGGSQTGRLNAGRVNPSTSPPRYCGCSVSVAAAMLNESSETALAAEIHRSARDVANLAIHYIQAVHIERGCPCAGTLRDCGGAR